VGFSNSSYVCRVWKALLGLILYFSFSSLFGFFRPGTKISSVIPVSKNREPNLLTIISVFVSLVSVLVILVRFFDFGLFGPGLLATVYICCCGCMN
jgi:hypothetical protein